jgi:hypothetical protein
LENCLDGPARSNRTDPRHLNQLRPHASATQPCECMQETRATRHERAAAGPHRRQRFTWACGAVQTPSPLAGYKRASTRWPKLLLLPFWPKNRELPSPPVSHRFLRSSLNSFLLESLHSLTVLLPCFLQLKPSSFDLYTESHRHLPLTAGESSLPCSSSPVAV